MAISLHGYFKAKTAAEKYGMNVIMAAEFEFEKTYPNHYLTLGITREFLDSHPDICRMSIEEFSKIAKENNIFIIQAHPFRDGNNFPTPDFVDAMEILNANPRHEDSSEKAKKTAEDNGLYICGGSDAHRTEDVGRGGIITETEIKTAQDLINAIMSRKIEIIC